MTFDSIIFALLSVGFAAFFGTMARLIHIDADRMKNDRNYIWRSLSQRRNYWITIVFSWCFIGTTMIIAVYFQKPN